MRLTLLFLSLALYGCGAEHGPYHLILVERERHFLDINKLEPCKQSGFDILPKDPDEQRKANVVELWITFENCGMKEQIILDDAGRVMWGVPLHEEPKQKGKLGIQ